MSSEYASLARTDSAPNDRLSRLLEYYTDNV